MTDERRQDVLLAALVASVVAHVALMVFMKPQVMTHVSGEFSRHRARGPMAVREAPPPAEAVAMEAVRDVEALRESPEARVDDPAPGALADDSAAPEGASAPEVRPPEALPAPEPSVEVAPFLSEKLHMDRDVPSFPTAVVERGEPLSAPRLAAPAASGADAPPAEVPLFTAPTYVQGPPEDAVSVHEPIPQEEEPDAAQERYEPPAEVMASVEEAVVEKEKAAVRDMLDVRNAEELAKVVDVAAKSASAGEWTYFRVLINPRPDLKAVPKDVVVLLDASGSIGDDRLKSCRSAARRILRSCTNTGDRFNLVAFRDSFSYAFRTWQPCDAVSFNRADIWLSSLASHGRTDVFSVIRSVLTLPRTPERPLIALVVTDGDANAGVSETAAIISKFTELNDGLVSVYMYGVKESANRELIDVLTRGNRGEGFVFGGKRWNAGSGIEGLSERFRDPVLSDLRVVFAADSGAEAFPRRLKNLYRGETVEIVGRIPKGKGLVAFSVKGLAGGKPYEGFFRVDLAQSGFDAGLPAAWEAERAIDARLR